MWEQGFLTLWGTSHLPYNFQHNPGRYSAAPQTPSASVERVEVSQGPRQPWEVGGAEITWAWSSQVLRVPRGGTLLARSVEMG